MPSLLPPTEDSTEADHLGLDSFKKAISPVREPQTPRGWDSIYTLNDERWEQRKGTIIWWAFKSNFPKASGVFPFHPGVRGLGEALLENRVQRRRLRMTYWKCKEQLHVESKAGWVPGDSPGARCCQASGTQRADLALFLTLPAASQVLPEDCTERSRMCEDNHGDSRAI